MERGLGSGSSRIGRTEKEGADGLTRGFGGYAPIFCRWDVLGRLWLTADALTVPSVGPKFRGGSWGGGASPAATCASWRLSSAANMPSAAGGEAIDRHAHGTARHSLWHLAADEIGEFIGVRIEAF